jgi:hypothetical protein
VSPFTLGMTDKAISELEKIRVDIFPDVPAWGQSALKTLTS